LVRLLNLYYSNHSKYNCNLITKFNVAMKTSLMFLFSVSNLVKLLIMKINFIEYSFSKALIQNSGRLFFDSLVHGKWSISLKVDDSKGK